MEKEKEGGNLLLDILNLLKSNVKPIDISKQLNISKQLLSYYLGRLKSKGLITKIGYGVWETSKNSTKVAEIRGHAFMWKVKNNLKLNWIKLLDEKKIKYKLIGLHKTPSILFKDRKIWLGKSNIIIYEPESFIGINAIETRKYAVFSLISILEALQSRLDINLKPIEFKVTRQHYSIIHNSLAIQCNKQGQKINIYNSKGLWFIIDNSYNLDECEQVHPESALIDNIGVQKFFNELKDLNFEATPKETWKAINQVTQNQLIFAENMKSHINAIQTIAKEIKGLSSAIKSIKKENQTLKLGTQRTLGEY